jgi:hypothetical protein
VHVRAVLRYIKKISNFFIVKKVEKRFRRAAAAAAGHKLSWVFGMRYASAKQRPKKISAAMCVATGVLEAVYEGSEHLTCMAKFGGLLVQRE